MCVLQGKVVYIPPPVCVVCILQGYREECRSLARSLAHLLAGPDLRQDGQQPRPERCQHDGDRRHGRLLRHPPHKPGKPRHAYTRCASCREGGLHTRAHSPPCKLRHMYTVFVLQGGGVCTHTPPCTEYIQYIQYIYTVRALQERTSPPSRARAIRASDSDAKRGLWYEPSASCAHPPIPPTPVHQMHRV